MEQKANIGDMVRFGAYGDFSDSNTLYEVVDIEEGVFIKNYTLKAKDGHTFIAYPDEVSVVISY